MKRVALLCLFSTVAFAGDRDIAEWVIRWEGLVTLAGHPQPVGNVSQLPAGEVQITGIDLTGSVLPPVELVKLSRLEHLRDLFLPGPVWNPGGSNENVDGVFETLGSLKTLERLYVGWHFATNINIRDEGIAALRGLTQMRDLRCSQCRLTKADFSAFVKLQSLDLNNTGFTDAGLAGLANLKQLRRLLLHDTIINDDRI